MLILQEVADEFWQKHKERNDSMVESLFLGQFKSTLVCPVCQETSVVFDPFLSMSIPLPRKMLSRAVIFIPQDPSKVPVRVSDVAVIDTGGRFIQVPLCHHSSHENLE